MKKILESKMVVRFQDCDPYQHLNNSKYIDYMLNAREDQLKDHYEFDIYKIVATQKKGWVITGNQIAYFRSARVMEEVVVETFLIEANSRELLVEKRMWNKDKSEMKALLWTKYGHIDVLKMKSAEHPEEMQGFFNSVVIPIEEKTFEDRKVALLRLLKKRA